MNIAFEISPFITASGAFGDKSGVYRYMYGLISSLSEKLEQKDKNAKIVLFSFSLDLIKQPLNFDILKLTDKKNIIILNKYPKFKNNQDFENAAIFNLPFLKLCVKAVNKLFNIKFNIKSLYLNCLNRIKFNKYLSFLTHDFKKNKVSIIFHSQTGFFPLTNFKFKHISTIYDLTPIFMEQYHRAETQNLLLRKLKFVKKFCDGIICISQSTKKDLICYSKAFKNKKIVIAYPGLDPNFQSYSHRQPPAASRQSLTLSNKCLTEANDLKLILNNNIPPKKYLLYYGTFEPRKNLIYLVKAFADLKENKEIPDDFILVLCGGDGWGNIKRNIKNYLRENYISKEKSVIVIDYLNDNYLRLLIKNAYAVVYPSLYEGFGLPVLESMALGTPVICSNNSSLPEVGKDAVLYINPADFLDLKNKIKYLINNPAVAKKLSEKGIIQSKKFTWEKTAKKVMSFLETL